MEEPFSPAKTLWIRSGSTDPLSISFSSIDGINANSPIIMIRRNRNGYKSYVPPHRLQADELCWEAPANGGQLGGYRQSLCRATAGSQDQHVDLQAD